MSAALPWLLLISLSVHLGAHVTMVVRLGKEKRWLEAALGLFLSPLAAWWSWRAGMRRTPIAWAGGLAAYALGVALA